jgi:hypothetical protein
VLLPSSNVDLQLILAVDGDEGLFDLDLDWLESFLDVGELGERSDRLHFERERLCPTP